jgi:DNA repair exonuclease SbcCD ATPase subunit
MTDNPLNNALNGLGATIETITQKVETGKQKVKAYKDDIIKQLKNVVDQLEQLKKNSKLSSIPQLQGQLINSNEALQKKNEELNQTKKQLEDSNRELTNLREKINIITSDLERKNKELTDALYKSDESNKEKDKIIQGLNTEIQQLKQQKDEAERKLNATQQDINSLIQRIAMINDTLVKQIGLIDTIAGELGDNSDITEGFQAISGNIQAIINMINSSDRTSQPQPISSYDKFVSLSQSQKTDLINKISQINEAHARMITEDYPKSKTDITKKQNVENILSKYVDMMRGGKRRRRTMKKRSKKTKKILKGGYVYSFSKELDKASSVVSNSIKTPNTMNKNKRSTRKYKNK